MAKVVTDITIKKLNILYRIFNSYTAVAMSCQVKRQTAKKYINPEAVIELDIDCVRAEATTILKSYAFRKAIKGEKGADVCYRMAKDLENKQISDQQFMRNYSDAKQEMDKL